MCLQLGDSDNAWLGLTGLLPPFACKSSVLTTPTRLEEVNCWSRRIVGHHESSCFKARLLCKKWIFDWVINCYQSDHHHHYSPSSSLRAKLRLSARLLLSLRTQKVQTFGSCLETKPSHVLSTIKHRQQSDHESTNVSDLLTRWWERCVRH